MTNSKIESLYDILNSFKQADLHIPVLFGYPDLFEKILANYEYNYNEKSNHSFFSLLNGNRYNAFKVENVDNFINNSYTEFTITKKSGGIRRIISPNKELSEIQKKIKILILDKIKISKNAYGFRKHKNIMKNAYKHCNHEIVLNLDLKNFFESINDKRVYYIFNNICGYRKIISIILTKFTTYKGTLPQGACTSPVISNIVAYMLDIRLNNLCEKFNVTYTRYADDMTFSGDKNIINNSFLNIIKTIIQEEGFQINNTKTRFAGKHKQQKVTGLIVNNKTVHVSKNYLKNIEQELYFIKKYGIENCKNHLKYKGNYEQHLLGKIIFVKQIDKDIGKKLLKKYNANIK